MVSWFLNAQISGTPLSSVFLPSFFISTCVCVCEREFCLVFIFLRYFLNSIDLECGHYSSSLPRSIWRMDAFETRIERASWSENKDSGSRDGDTFHVSAFQMSEAEKKKKKKPSMILKASQRCWSDSPGLPYRTQTYQCSWNISSSNKLRAHFCKCTLWNKHVNHKMALSSFNGWKIASLLSLSLPLSSISPFF